MMEIRETTREDMKRIMSVRPDTAHKGQAGRVLLLCGSKGMSGAAVLCAKATIRSGAGLVTVAVPEELYPILQTTVPEVMCTERSALFLSDKPVDLNGFDAIAIGCGIGVSEENLHFIRMILEQYKGPVVIDADGINCFDRSLIPIISERNAPTVMTPHPGEAGRLMNALEEKMDGHSREDIAAILADRTGAFILLKGHGTLITSPLTVSSTGDVSDRMIYINRTGNPGMATGGSGDVLTGVITALAASSIAFADRGDTSERKRVTKAKAVDIVRAAAFIHGLAGDLAADDLGETGMTSMDIVDYLPYAFKDIIGR